MFHARSGVNGLRDERTIAKHMDISEQWCATVKRARLPATVALLLKLSSDSPRSASLHPSVGMSTALIT